MDEGGSVIDISPQRAVGWPWDDRWVWLIRLREFGAPARRKAGKSVHGRELCSIIRHLGSGIVREAGWSWGCVSAIDANGQTIWIADAHRDDGNRSVVRAEAKLTAFVELESATSACGELS